MGKVVSGYPYDPTSRDPAYIKFIEDFKEKYGDAPETYAAHAFDGMNMLIAAIDQAGLNRALIRDALAEMKTFPGVTGQKEFDMIYNNVSPPTLAIVENGAFHFYTREALQTAAVTP